MFYRLDFYYVFRRLRDELGSGKGGQHTGILLSVFGVLMTAGITGLFCHYVLGMTLLEGMLIGSVVGSTDAASVFSILRSKVKSEKWPCFCSGNRKWK